MADETLVTLAPSLLGYVALTTVEGLVEKLGVEGILGQYSKLRDNLKQYRPDGNHELQEAILQSYLQATLQVCIVHGEDLGISSQTCFLKELLPRFLAKAEIFSRRLANPTVTGIEIDESLLRKNHRDLPDEIKTKAEILGNRISATFFGEVPTSLGLLETPTKGLTDPEKWLKHVIEEYTELLTQLREKKLIFPESIDNPELNDLIGVKGLLMQAKNAQQREDIIRKRLLSRVETELTSNFGPMPVGFHRFYVDNWFNYFCGCFQYGLARHPELARKFQSKLLSNIEANTDNIIGTLEKFSGEFGERLKGIEGYLAWLHDQHELRFDEIRHLLLSMMPLLVTIDEPGLRQAIVYELEPQFEQVTSVVERTASETQGVVVAYGKKILATLDDRNITTPREIPVPTSFRIATVANQVHAHIKELYDRAPRHDLSGLATGFLDLDNLTSGLQRTDLVLVAAPPSVGKSGLCTNVALNAARLSNAKIAYFPIEMSKEHVVARMLSIEASIDAHRLRTGYLTGRELERLDAAVGSLSDARIFIDDTPGISINELGTKATLMAAEYDGLDLIVVDDVHLMGNSPAEMTQISRSLKVVARKLNVPVLISLQIRPAPEERNPPEPSISDLREYGRAEQIADLIVFLYREEYYYRTEENAGLAELIIAKNRYGTTSTVRLSFLAQFSRYENLFVGDETLDEDVF